MKKPTLYHYWRSSCSWRVRWGLAIKGVEVEYVPVHLLKDEQKSPEHLARNPMGYVPALEVEQNGKPVILSESIAILEWLEETYPKPALLPGDSFQRAHIRKLCELINSGTQPLMNIGVQNYYSTDSDKKLAWSQHWILKGMKAFETSLASWSGKFSVGDTLTLADVCLVPQCYGALRNQVDLSQFPTLKRIYENCLQLESCKSSHPERFEPKN